MILTPGAISIKIKMPHVKDYKNPLHLDVVDEYLRRINTRGHLNKDKDAPC